MKKIIAKLQRFERIRQLHTIISQETIKPSSPTPPHLKIHKYALVDHFATHIHMPWIFFYKNYKNGDINILKKSLSQCLTQYYPFAGRFLSSPSVHHIDCNDQGVEFLEASINTSLDNFILKKEQDKTLDHLIPNGLGCSFEKTSPNMLEVQLNHFTCGGAAVGVSISHKIADGFTMLNLCNHWASVTRGLSPVNPSFSNLYISNIKIPEMYPHMEETFKTKYANRIFVFPNSKLNELKKKINATGTTPVNPSRVESLTSLLFKCATTAKSGYFHPSNLYQIVNMRNKTAITDFPKLMAGNLSPAAIAKLADSNQIEVITSLRKEIMKLHGVRDVKELGDIMVNCVLEYNNGCPNYACSSVCRFPFYEVDFGWGKPVRVMFRAANPGNNIVLMDTPCGDGVEATVQLEEDVMATFQHDKELLAYAQDI